MLKRALPLCLALAVAALVCASATAQEKPGAKANTHEGWFEGVKDGKLMMMDQGRKKEHTHRLAADVKVTCDGKACKITDLKKGTHIRVTMHKEGEHNAVTRIDASTRVKPGTPER